MSILRNSGCNKPKKIIQSFIPFEEPDKIDGMIIGNDLDSLLSSCLLKEIFDWDIVGIYNYRTIWFSGSVSDFKEKINLQKILAVDLDVYNNNIPSIGHHILAMNQNDLIPGHSCSLNPNLIRGIHHDQFTRKYPLGTIHFLLWLFEYTHNLDHQINDLIWLADSSYINGQSHRFRSNVGEWLNFFRDKVFLNTFEEIDSKKFENRINDTIIPLIHKTGLKTYSGQVKSLYLSLSGCQCQWNDPIHERKNIFSMYNLINDVTGWKKPDLPKKFGKINGNRANKSINNFLRGHVSLDDFLYQKNVFSYVFPSSSTINYSTNINLN